MFSLSFFPLLSSRDGSWQHVCVCVCFHVHHFIKAKTQVLLAREPAAHCLEIKVPGQVLKASAVELPFGREMGVGSVRSYFQVDQEQWRGAQLWARLLGGELCARCIWERGRHAHLQVGIHSFSPYPIPTSLSPHAGDSPASLHPGPLSLSRHARGSPCISKGPGKGVDPASL